MREIKFDRHVSWDLVTGVFVRHILYEYEKSKGSLRKDLS